MEDDNSMSERILRRMEHIINNDSELKDFTIIPTEENSRNKSPVLYMNHSLGLESWCVKHVYRHACADLFEVRHKLASGKLTFVKMENLNHLLNGALLINPDVATFWAMKRELVESDIISREQELFFSKIVLSHKSKSNEAFAHRRWLLKRLLLKVSDNSQRIHSLLQKEFIVTEMAALKSPNNYHCWNHRIWCMENLASNLCDNQFHIAEIVENELRFTAKWLQEHVSEHTGYHYRQYLIKLLKNHKQITHISASYYSNICSVLRLYPDTTSILTYLLGKSNKSVEETNRIMNLISLLIYDLSSLIKSLNTFFEGHESLWYHRRFVVFELIKTIYEFHNVPFEFNKNINNLYANPSEDSNIIENSYCTDQFINVHSTESGEKLPKLTKFMPNKIESDTNLYSMIVQWEKDFISSNKKNRKNLVQMEFVRRHEQWLRLFLGLNLG